MPTTPDYEMPPVELVLPKRQLVPASIEFVLPLNVVDEQANPRVYSSNVVIVSKVFDNGAETRDAPVRTIVDLSSKNLVVLDKDNQPINVDLGGADAVLAKAFADLRAAVDVIHSATLAASPADVNRVAIKVAPALVK